MKKIVAAATAVGLLVAASGAFAAPPPQANPNPNAGANGCGATSPGGNQDLLILLYGSTGSPTPDGHVDSLGGAISGGFYGNTSNSGIDVDAPARGHGVTPSISPGPQTVNGGGPGTGTSVGDLIQLLCPN